MVLGRFPNSLPTSVCTALVCRDGFRPTTSLPSHPIPLRSVPIHRDLWLSMLEAHSTSAFPPAALILLSLVLFSVGSMVSPFSSCLRWDAAGGAG